MSGHERLRVAATQRSWSLQSDGSLRANIGAFAGTLAAVEIRQRAECWYTYLTIGGRSSDYTPLKASDEDAAKAEALLLLDTVLLAARREIKALLQAVES